MKKRLLGVLSVALVTVFLLMGCSTFTYSSAGCSSGGGCNAVYYCGTGGCSGYWGGKCDC